jgi:hypothetical protein
VYLRHSIIRKDGKKHVYWRLVRSVRRNGKVVQETVAQLGELDAEGRAKAKALARQITGRGEQRELFEESVAGEATVPVRLDRIRLERGRSFGGVWLGWRLWQALRLDVLCEELLPRGREQVPWPVMAAVLVIARLCEPASELHLAEDWYRRTALEDLLGLPCERLNEDRLYRALDRLLPHKAAIEQHLVKRLGVVKRLGELFDLSYDLLLYDVTSTYFEGLAERNPLAQRGHSRDHRPDCKQDAAGLRGLCGQPDGRDHGRGDRGDDGGALRDRGSGLGDGPRDVECGERDVVAGDGASLPDRDAQERAQEVERRDRGGPGLAHGARRGGGEAVPGA